MSFYDWNISGSFSVAITSAQESARGQWLAQVTSLRSPVSKINAGHPLNFFWFSVADIEILKEKIDMNNSRCTKAEKNDFDFDLLIM